MQSYANSVQTFFGISQIRVQGHHLCFYNTEAHLKLQRPPKSLIKCTVKGKTHPSYVVFRVVQLENFWFLRQSIEVFYLTSAILHGKISLGSNSIPFFSIIPIRKEKNTTMSSTYHSFFSKMVAVYGLPFQNRTCSGSPTQDLECGTNGSVHVD